MPHLESLFQNIEWFVFPRARIHPDVLDVLAGGAHEVDALNLENMRICHKSQVLITVARLVLQVGKEALAEGLLGQEGG